jgi:hypothetical protein
MLGTPPVSNSQKEVEGFHQGCCYFLDLSRFVCLAGFGPYTLPPLTVSCDSAVATNLSKHSEARRRLPTVEWSGITRPNLSYNRTTSGVWSLAFRVVWPFVVVVAYEATINLLLRTLVELASTSFDINLRQT